MDAASLMNAKRVLKRQSTRDASKPLVEDAAHPGSASILRQISVGRFDLKHTEVQHDASKPALEQGTSFHTDARPAVFAELQRKSTKDLRHVTKANDRSEPMIEKWVHLNVTSKPARASVIDELKQKRESIEALHTYNEHHAKSEIEKFVRPDLMAELKKTKSVIDSVSKNCKKNSVEELQKHVHNPLMAEIHQKQQSIKDFAAYAAEHQADQSYRSMTHPSLVNEIKLKRPSIDALTKLHRQNTGTIDVN